VGVLGAFYSIAYREESIESLDQGGMSVEKMRYTFDYPRSVDTLKKSEKLQSEEPLNAHVWLLDMMSRK
jgi:hypothetical protein